eukprot:scaffold76261_cov33-Tisochrysis_lutea.AAC.3
MCGAYLVPTQRASTRRKKARRERRGREVGEDKVSDAMRRKAETKGGCEISRKAETTPKRRQRDQNTCGRYDRGVEVSYEVSSPAWFGGEAAM